MRKVLSVFIAACLVLSLFTGIFVSMPSARADIAEGDYTYIVAGSNATITGYAGLGGAIVIPSTLGGCPVTTIGDVAFFSKVALTSVTIPNSVTSIGAAAFSACRALTSVTIPNSVTSIEAGAFQSCTKLITVTIPNSVTTIRNYAFSYCTALTSIAIGSGVTSIDTQVFYDCTALTSIAIGSGVTSIDTQAFYDCMALTSIAIGSSVTSIGDSAFQGCAALTSVTIPNSVTSIGSYAFQGCTGLIAAHFSGNAPRMSASVFDSCAPGFTVWYISGANGWTNPWYGYPTATKTPKTVVVLQIGKSTFTVNGASKMLDSPPVIKNGRTLVPIRTIIEALGGTVSWDATTKKATVTLGNTTMQLWIGNSTAKVNGKDISIDKDDAKVVPEIINSRTMIPLRFVAENLGCDVLWDPATKTVTIKYPKS